ncbi:hypothetical protein JMJ77_0013084, partial [Colletotrichum scovillei]
FNVLEEVVLRNTQQTVVTVRAKEVRLGSQNVRHATPADGCGCCRPRFFSAPSSIGWALYSPVLAPKRPRLGGATANLIGAARCPELREPPCRVNDRL